MRRLVGQRLVGLGYEDLNDHDELRDDSMLALAGDDLTGENRDRSHPLAGSSALNRLEPGVPGKDDRYKKTAADTLAVDDLQVDIFPKSYSSPPEEIHLDLDCTDGPLHGNQEGRFFHGYYVFHGYYGCYRYLPLYVVCGDHELCSRLRPSNVDGAAVEELSSIVERQALAANHRSRRRRAATISEVVRRQRCRRPVRPVPQRPSDGRQAAAQVAQPLRFDRQGPVLRLPLPDPEVVEPHAAGSRES